MYAITILIFTIITLCNAQHSLTSPLLQGKDDAFRAVDPINDILFQLYSKKHPTNPEQIFVGDLNGASFDPNLPTKFFIHGYNSGPTSGWIINVKDAYFRIEDCNAIAVDWSIPGNGPFYNEARSNVNVTGDYLGELYTFLASLGADMGDMHCMGHSLGAHVCGFSGKKVEGAIGRITGLDPALPLFDYDAPNERLSSTDAIYVDVIHSCGGFMGFQAPIGHADYYPNSGSWIQPGCGADVSGGCSHERCHEYFLESIESPKFIAHECGSWEEYTANACVSNAISIMGNPSSTSSRGNFYLATASESPYALG